MRTVLVVAVGVAGKKNFRVYLMTEKETELLFSMSLLLPVQRLGVGGSGTSNATPTVMPLKQSIQC